MALLTLMGRKRPSVPVRSLDQVCLGTSAFAKTEAWIHEGDGAGRGHGGNRSAVGGGGGQKGD